MNWDYNDLILEIDRADKGYKIKAEIRQNGQQASEVFPYEEVAKVQDILTEIILGGIDNNKASNSATTLGAAYFRALFPRRVLPLYASAGLPLRIQLRISNPELAAVPWEFINDEDYDAFVACAAGRSIVRYPESPRPSEPLKVQSPLRILGIAPQPKDFDALNVEAEKVGIEKALEPLINSKQVEVKWIEEQTLDALDTALDQEWHVLHFIGHGDFDNNQDNPKGILYFCSPIDGHSDPVEAGILADRLTKCRTLRIVFLSACRGGKTGFTIHSSTAATLLRRGCNAVIAMQFLIMDKDAVSFSKVFYRELAKFVPLEEAVVRGRQVLRKEGVVPQAWATPVLYLRSEDSRIFVSPIVNLPQNGDLEKSNLTKTIFISYSHKDKMFAERLVDDLTKLGYKVWFDQRTLMGGEDWLREIAEEIDQSSVFVLIASNNSLKSQYVRDEVTWAKKREKAIVPVLLEDVTQDKYFFPLVNIQSVKFYEVSYKSAFQALRIALGQGGALTDVSDIRQPFDIRMLWRSFDVALQDLQKALGWGRAATSVSSSSSRQLSNIRILWRPLAVAIVILLTVIAFNTLSDSGNITNIRYIPIPLRNVQRVVVDHDDNVWFTSYNDNKIGLYLWQDDTQTLSLRYMFPTYVNKIYDLFADCNNNIWVSVRENQSPVQIGVLVLSKTQNTIIDTVTQDKIESRVGYDWLGNIPVLAIAGWCNTSNEATIWLGNNKLHTLTYFQTPSLANLNFLSDAQSTISNYFAQIKLPYISRIAVSDLASRVWILTSDAVLTAKVSGDQNPIIILKGLNGTFQSFALDAKVNQAIIETAASTIETYDSRGILIETVKISQNAYGSAAVLAFRDGIIWRGGQCNQESQPNCVPLIRISRGTVQNASLSTVKGIYDLAFDNLGRLWIATDQGLSVYPS